MKKDVTSKRVIKSISKDIAKYILKLNITDITFIDKELKRIETRESDIVAKCKIDGIDSFLHIEIQSTNDLKMPYRMLRYYTDIKTLDTKLPIKQYLIYIGKPKCSMKNGIEEPNLSFQYSVIDMHNIDCEDFISQDTPEALILAILCDFKDKDELEVVYQIVKRLKELTKDKEKEFRDYLLILEILSTNRELKSKVKEAEQMLKDVKLEELPSYEIGMEKGIEKGIEKGMEKGMEKGKIESAILIIDKYNLSVEEVSKDLDIPLELLKKYIK